MLQYLLSYFLSYRQLYEVKNYNMLQLQVRTIIIWGGSVLDKIRKNMWLFISIGAIMFFMLTLLTYIEKSPLPYWGPWLLILISGAVVAILSIALVFSVINLWRYKFHWQGPFTIVLNVIAIIPISYAFVIWVIIMIVNFL